MKKLNIFLTTQFITLIGSELTRFALPIWIYQKTNSNTFLTLSMFATFVPRVFLGPYSGSISDTYNPKKVILISDCVQAIGTFLILLNLLFFNNLILLPFLLMASLINGIGNIFQFSAISKILPTLVEKEKIVQANSMMSTVEKMAEFSGPILAGFLLNFTSMKTLILIDITTFLIATSIFYSFIPYTNFSSVSVIKKKELIKNSLKGIRIISKNNNLICLLTLSCVTNFCFSITFIFITPILLSLKTSETTIGLFYSMASLGQILGSYLVGKIKPPKNLLKSESIGTIVMAILGFGPIAIMSSPWIVALGLIFTMFALMPLNIWNRSNWYNLINEENYGVIFATKRSISSFLGMFGYLFSGLFVDQFLNNFSSSPLFSYKFIFIFSISTLILISITSLYISKEQHE